MDRVGAEFHRCVEMIADRLGATPLVVQLPWGVESDFRGVIDLVRMRALVWQTEGKGDKYDVVAIPDDHAEAAREYRDRLLETIAENDDEMMELYLEGIEPTEEQLIAAIRRATISGALTPVLCGTAFKNKGVQPMLDAIVDYLPSPVDIPAVKGHEVGDVPGPGDQRRHRAEDQERPGEAGHRHPAARRGGPDLPGQDRRGNRPDDHRRHGRAAPGGAGRPHAARVQGRGQHRPSAGRQPGDRHPQGGEGRVHAQEADRWLRR